MLFLVSFRELLGALGRPSANSIGVRRIALKFPPGLLQAKSRHDRPGLVDQCEYLASSLIHRQESSAAEFAAAKRESSDSCSFRYARQRRNRRNIARLYPTISDSLSIFSSTFETPSYTVFTLFSRRICLPGRLRETE